jgi:glutathione peroxidase
MKKYKGNLVIIGFPANNFGQQEPGTNAEIKEFCSKNYGVTFPMAEKVSVKVMTSILFSNGSQRNRKME